MQYYYFYLPSQYSVAPLSLVQISSVFFCLIPPKIKQTNMTGNKNTGRSTYSIAKVICYIPCLFTLRTVKGTFRARLL